mgnify:CR=1 FL=1
MLWLIFMILLIKLCIYGKIVTIRFLVNKTYEKAENAE